MHQLQFSVRIRNLIPHIQTTMSSSPDTPPPSSSINSPPPSPLPLRKLQSLSNRIISSATLSPFLGQIPHVLASLDHTSESQRKEALSIIKHINTRLRASPPEVTLPQTQILKLFIDKRNGVFLKQFAKLFLQIDKRWPENVEAIPVLMFALGTANSGTGTTPSTPSSPTWTSDDEDFLYRLIAKRLAIEVDKVRSGAHNSDDELDAEYLDPQQKEWRRMKYYFSFLDDNSEAKSKLLAFFTDVLLFRFEDQQNGGVSSPAFWRTKRRLVANTKETISSDFLFDLKVAIYRMLEAEIFEHDDTLIPIIIGMCDYNQSLATIAERTMRKLDVDYEQEKIVDYLMKLFLDQMGRVSTENEKRKCLVMLRKSERAAKTFPQAREILSRSLLSSMASLTVRRLGFDFFQWMIEVSFEATNEHHEEEARIIFAAMNDQLQQSENSSDKDAISLVESLYISIGQLARRYPRLVAFSFKYAQMFFNALEKYASIRQGVNQGLGSLIMAYSNPAPQIEKQFHELFFSVVENPGVSQFSLMAILQSANRLFNFNDIPSRFLNLLCAGHNSLRVREEARRGMSISSFQKYRYKHDKSEQQYPDFVLFVKYITQQYEARSVIPTEVHAATVEFARTCLRETAKRDDISLSQYVSQQNNDTLNQFTNIAKRGFNVTANADSLYESAYAFLDVLVNIEDKSFISSVVHLNEIFQKSLFAGDDRSRRAVAKLVAVLFAYDANGGRREALITHLKNNLKGPKVPERHSFASLQCLGFISALLAKQYYFENKTDLLPVIKDIIQDILSLFESETKDSIVLASVEALGYFARQNGFDLLEENKKPVDNAKAIPAEKRRKLSASKMSLIQSLLARMKSTKVVIIKEGLVSTLGMLSLAEKDASILSDIRESIVNMATVRNEEFIFSAGEALSAICGGRRHCSAYKDELENLIGKFSNQSEEARNEQLKLTLQYIVRQGVLSGKRIVRQSSAIFLLCVLQYTSKMPELQKYLAEMQQVFTILLSDTNEVTTEIAARGLALVYELSDDEHRNTLVEAIQDQLSGNAPDPKKKVKITEDTDLNLFPKGEEPQSRGKRVPGNYKELLDAAQDVGDPSMIYKLLSVSQHNQIWNTKKAAAFSAVSIVTQTQDKEKLRKILPQLVPKLYRYRHDPNHLISKSMQNMWDSLVENSVKTVDEYLPQILKEISSGLSSSMWRIRESCSLALAEAVSGRKFEEVEPFLGDILLKLFRCCDDVKESSRKAANSTLKKVSEVTHRFCNVRKSKLDSVHRALDILIPLYLKTGLVFMYKPIISFSLHEVYTITKLAEHAIKPHAAEIVATLLESVSAFEDATFSYVQQHRQRMNLSQEQLDKIRMDATKGTSVDETIQLIVPHCDESVMPDLVPKLLHLISHAVGLPTRAAVSRFVSDIAKFQRKAVRKFSPNLIKAMMTALQNTKSPGERSEIASSLPYLLNASTVRRCKKVLEDILLFYERGDHDDHLTAGVVLLMIHRRVPVLISKFYDMLIPVIFLATFDKNDKVSHAWTDLFQDSLPSTETESIRLHLEPILKECYTSLTRSAWSMKQQGGSALARVAQLLKNSIPSKHRLEAMEKLIDALKGRVWTGKEELLHALGNFVSTTRESDSENLTLIEITRKSISVLVRECSKKNKEYKLEAFRALQSALKEKYIQQLLDGHEMATEIKELCIQQFEEVDTEGSSKIQMGSNDDSDLLLSKSERLKVEAVSCLGFLTQQTLIREVIQYVSGGLQGRHTIPETKALIRATRSLLEHLKDSKDEKNSDYITPLIRGLLFQLNASQAPEKVRLFNLQQTEKLLIHFHLEMNEPSLDELSTKMQNESVSSLKARYEYIIGEIKGKEEEIKQLEEAKKAEEERKKASSASAPSSFGQEDRSFGGNPFGSFGGSANPFG